MANRIIGIRSRVKKTTTGEARPTEVYIVDENPCSVSLGTEQDEVDFILGELPTGYQPVMPEDDLTHIPNHLIRWGEVPCFAEPDLPPSQKLFIKAKRGKDAVPEHWLIAMEIPSGYEGIQSGDRVVMLQGGSGDELARAIAKDGFDRDVEVWRTPAYRLKIEREKRGWGKDRDPELLTIFYQQRPHLFHQFRTLEGEIAELIPTEEAWLYTMQKRIERGNQLHAGLVGLHIRARRAGQPVDTLKIAFDYAKKTDSEYLRREADEKALLRDLEVRLDRFPIWSKVLAGVDGIGVSLGSRIIAGVGDFQSFMITPEPIELATLRAIADEACKPGHYEEGKAQIPGIEDGTSGFQRLCRVRTFWLENDRNDLAAHLQRAIDVLKQIRDLNARAFRQGMNKFVAIGCGHVNPDGSLCRFRRDQPDDWPKGRPELRLAGLLFGEQCQKRPNSEWGARLRLNQSRQRGYKGQPVQVENKDGELKWRYKDGHILRMARQRTWTQFLRWLYKQWYHLELSSR